MTGALRAFVPSRLRACFESSRQCHLSRRRHPFCRRNAVRDQLAHRCRVRSERARSVRRGLSVDEILHEFPHLTAAQLYDALSYYYDYPEQIDEKIAELTLERTAHHYPPTIRPSDDPDHGLS